MTLLWLAGAATLSGVPLVPPRRLEACTSSCVSGVAYGLVSAYQISLLLLTIKRRPPRPTAIDHAATQWTLLDRHLHRIERRLDALGSDRSADAGAAAGGGPPRGSDAKRRLKPEAASTYLSSSRRRDVTTSGGGSVAKMALLFYTLYGFAVFFFAGWWVVWLLHLLAIFNGKLKLHKKKSPPPLEVPLPGVSIIKPLTGVDPNLFSNLESFFTMSYPQYEILFCIQDESDPSIMLVNRLMEKHPLVDARVFVGGCPVGVNPKINNMQPGYEAAKYDLILVSDSGLRMKEDTLLDMVLTMTDNVALVHQMPFVCDRKGFPAILEKVFFGTAHARIYLAADLLRINCATGMSALMRKKLLDDVGGIRAFAQYLAEDFFFAKSFAERWAKLRFAMVPHTTALEPFSECMLLGMLVAWAASFLFQWDAFVVYLLHLLLWFLLDWMLLSIVQNGLLPFSKWEFVVAWTFRECGALYLYLNALWDPTIRWRTGLYRLRWGGTVEVVKPKS